MRRRAPRPLASALEALTRDAAPQTTIARVQACWNEAVGAAIAEEARPVAERDGTLTVMCRSGTWANELELLAPELLEKLNSALGGNSEPTLKALRAKVGA
jgi:predicted nucleic acid-binding Zn ribbon protein